MKEISILCPTGHLAFTPLEKGSFLAGCRERPDYIIADAIRAAGVEAAKANVRLPEGPFKAVGEYEVEVALHTDAVAKITVAVVAAVE